MFELQNDEKKPEALWAIVELFGHQRIAGKLSEHTMGGGSFVRVDVPEIPPAGEGMPSIPGFTKLYGNGAIYGITFVDEAAALVEAARLRTRPVNVWDLREGLQALGADNVQRLGLTFRDPGA